MPARVKQRLSALLFCLSVLICMPATGHTESFSTTNLQLLYGSNFHDNYYGNNTADGKMTTLTLEHFGLWAYGDHHFFIDLKSGDFLDFAGNPTATRSRIYSEWAPRISLSALTGHNLGFSIFKDFFIAGQINRDGEGFKADMGGIGIDLTIPGFNLLSLHGYLRKDNFNNMTWQSTAVWMIPIGQWLSFEGFIDLYGTDNNGMEIHSQPQLLFNPGKAADLGFDNLLIGLEWYYHRNRNLNSSVLQGMVKWVW